MARIIHQRNRSVTGEVAPGTGWCDLTSGRKFELDYT